MERGIPARHFAVGLEILVQRRRVDDMIRVLES